MLTIEDCEILLDFRAVKAKPFISLDKANEKIQPLLDENERLKEQLELAENVIRFIRVANAWPDLSEHKYITSGKLIHDEIRDYFYNKEEK